MKKAVLAATVVLLWSTWMVAQQSYPGQTAPDNTGKSVTVKGCLGRSDGGYTLTDASGNRFDVSGDKATLDKHVGHEVQVKGQAAESSTPGNPSATENRIQSRIEVSDVKHISETCDSKAKPSGKEDQPMSEKPPTPEKPPTIPPR